MWKKFLLLMTFAVPGIFVLLAGCAVPPQWAQEGEHTARDETEKAVFAVGKASAELTDAEDVRLAVARTEARTNLNKASRDYAGDFVRGLVDANDEWFAVEELDPFWDDFEDSLNAYLRFSSAVVDEWVDAEGRLDGAHTAYARTRQNLDEDFFHAVRESVAQALDAHEEYVLNVELEVVLSGLDESIERAIEQPFAALLPPEPEPEETVEEEPEEADDEETDNAEAGPEQNSDEE